MSNCGVDAHEHVRQCRHNERPGNVFVAAGHQPFVVFSRVNLQRQQREAERYIASSVSVDMRDEVRRFVGP